MKEVKEFKRKQVRKIATEYATSKCEYSAHYFAEHYNITEHVFYSVLKRAVVESIVTAEVADRIADKSAKNSGEHGGKGGVVRSEKAYMHYMRLRENFAFTKKEKAYYAEEYAKSPMTVNEFCQQQCIADRKLLERTLTSAIVDGLVSDEIVEMLREKSVRLNGERAKQLYSNLCAERKVARETKADLDRRRRQLKKEAKAKATAES